MDHAVRRAAALERLGPNLLVVPSQTSFKSDDQTGFQQASDFQYLTGFSDLVGAVLVLDGPAKTATLFLPPPSPVISPPALPVSGRPRPSPSICSAGGCHGGSARRAAWWWRRWTCAGRRAGRPRWRAPWPGGPAICLR